MKGWYSTKELAGLDGLPTTIKRVIEKAKREHWTKQKRAKGKGFEYHIDSLPEATRIALGNQSACEAANQYFQEDRAYVVAEQGRKMAFQAVEKKKAEEIARLKTKQECLAKFNRLSPDNPKKVVAYARQKVLYALGKYRRDNFDTIGQLKGKSREAFSAGVANGAISMPEDVMEHMPQYNGVVSINYKTLNRWEDAHHKEGILALIPKYKGQTGNGIIDKNPELEQFIVGALKQYPHITAQKIIDYIQAERPDLDLINKRSLQRWIKSWKTNNNQMWTQISNPDQFKNEFMAAFGSHHDHITRLNELWELDSSPADVMLKDGRHTIIAKIDMYSRRIRYFVSKSSTAHALNQLFRKSLLADGVPEAIRTDNGADYISQEFTNVIDALEIEIKLCVPFASEEKGTVERSFRTMAHGILDLLPGFIGHNVAERKAIEARKSFAQRIMTPGEVIDIELTAIELQEKLDQWEEFIYARNSHEGLKGKTPFEVMNAWQQPIRKIGDERALDALMLEPAGERTVGKKGIRLNHHYYIAPELVAYIDNYRGDKRVRIQYDEHDIGRIYVYEVDGPFICRAECHQLLGTNPQEVAVISKKLQRKLNSEARAFYKQGFKDMKVNMAEAILNHRIEESQNVCQLPKASEPYTTQGLEEAGKAARSGDAPVAAKTDVDMTAFNAEFNQPVSKITKSSPEEMYRRWARIEKRITDGLSVDVKDREGLKRYQELSEYTIMKEHFEDFKLPIDEEEVNEVALSIVQ